MTGGVSNGHFIVERMTYTIESIEESVEQVSCGNFDWLIDLIIDLV
jgi:hypothetical protein